MDDNKAVTATFTEDEYTLEIHVDGCLMGILLQLNFINVLKDFKNHRVAPDFKIRVTWFGVCEDMSILERRANNLFRRWR